MLLFFYFGGVLYFLSGSMNILLFMLIVQNIITMHTGMPFYFILFFLANPLRFQYLLSNYRLKFAFILGNFSFSSVKWWPFTHRLHLSLCGKPIICALNLWTYPRLSFIFSISIFFFCSLSDYFYLVFLLINADINRIHPFLLLLIWKSCLFVLVSENLWSGLTTVSSGVFRSAISLSTYLFGLVFLWMMAPHSCMRASSVAVSSFRLRSDVP